MKQLKKHKKTIAILSAVVFVGCASWKAVGKTADDAAAILCNLYAVENEDALGLGPADFCAIKENLQPFIDQALAAKREAGFQLARETPGE